LHFCRIKGGGWRRKKVKKKMLSEIDEKQKKGIEIAFFT